MKQKKYAVFLAGIMILIFTICIIVYKDQDCWERVKEDWNIEYPENTEYWVDFTEEQEGSYVIEGYAFVHNEILYTVNMAVILHDKEDDIYYKIKTDVNNLGDLTEFFNEGFDYNNGRFIARVRKSHLKEDHTYEIELLYKNNGYNFLIDTGKGVNINEE